MHKYRNLYFGIYHLLEELMKKLSLNINKKKSILHDNSIIDDEENEDKIIISKMEN